MKLSYSCTPNTGNIIAAQNKKLINKHKSLPNPQTYTCRNTKSCPLSGNCLEKNIIYQATARINSRTMNYFGLCETDFKTRYYSHTHSFRNRSKCKATELSKFVWECKTEDRPFLSTGNRFVAHHRTIAEMTIATSVWWKNLLFLLQTPKQYSTKEPCKRTSLEFI